MEGAIFRLPGQPIEPLARARLGEADDLAGNGFTAADIMSVFSSTTMRLFQPLDLRPYPNILGDLQRMGVRLA